MTEPLCACRPKVDMMRRAASAVGFIASLTQTLALIPATNAAATFPSLTAPTSVTAPKAIAPISSQPSLSSLPGTTLTGSPTDLAEKPGWKVIYFWGSVCPWVVACERACFVPLAREYAGRLTFYGIATNSYDLNMPRETLEQDIAAHHLPYSIILDPTHHIATTLCAISTPQTFVLDPHDRVVFVGMPADPTQHLFDIAATPKVPSRSYLSVALAEAMAGKPITPSPLRSAGCVVAW
jgi:hypothetical protein